MHCFIAEIPGYAKTIHPCAPSAVFWRENSSDTVSPNCLFWHLTLIDRGSALWLNTRPLPHNPLRGHKKLHCTSKQPTCSPPHHPTWHIWDNTDHNNGSIPLMVKCLSVYLHRAASLPVRQLHAAQWGSLKSSGRGSDAASRPGSLKRSGHIGNTCWRHMVRIRHRVFDRGVFFFLYLNGRREDENAAAVCSFDWSDCKVRLWDIWIENVFGSGPSLPVIKMWVNPQSCWSYYW